MVEIEDHSHCDMRIRLVTNILCIDKTIGNVLHNAVFTMMCLKFLDMG